MNAMKHKATKRFLSLLLAVVMLVGFLPTAAICVSAEELTYTKLGNIDEVTAECAAFETPVLEGAVPSYDLVITSPTDKGLAPPIGAYLYWQIHLYDDYWLLYEKDTFQKGTYRLCVQLTSSNDYKGNYYALHHGTTLTVNGVAWDELLVNDQYETAGYGDMVFASPSYVVSDPAVPARLGNVQKVEATTKGVDFRPVLGREPEPVYFSLDAKYPTFSDVYLYDSYWQIRKSDGSWVNFEGSTFTYGTYRLVKQLRSVTGEKGYYALTMDTQMIVDGVPWTPVEDSFVDAYTQEHGYGVLGFASPEMEPIPTLKVNDSCVACSVVPVNGEFFVPMGEAFSFTLKPKESYELTDPEKVVVYVNDEIVTPDANGVYTVKTGDKDLDIWTDGAGFTAYAHLVISANGITMTKKVYVGQSIPVETVEYYGATVPEGSTFTHWKVSGYGTYQPGESFTVKGMGMIRMDAVFTGLYNITVENGKAYADEAHTIPISVAAGDQVIHIVADPAPEGKVFSYWTEIEVATPGGDGWFGSYDAVQTTYTVYNSDVVIAPVYETLVDEIIIGGMTKPTPGVAIDNSDYSYKWGCSVPANSGYGLNTCYWYDITDGEPVKMNDGDVFQTDHKYRFEANVYLPGNGDTCFPKNAEEITAVLSGIDAEDYQWSLSAFSYVTERATICFEFACEEEAPDAVKGDMDNNGDVDVDDAIYLLQHVLMPELFQVRQPADMDKKDGVNVDDAIYLLQHVLMPNQFPLT